MNSRSIFLSGSSVLALMHLDAQTALAADQPFMIEEIIVTAQKRSENMQDVPVSILAFDENALKDRNVASFNDYAKFLPSLSYSSYGPGQAEVFFRGLSNGNKLSTGSLPTVGVYLDEQPVTTIGSAVDVHVYDIARVEALAGPQGTLFGASSEAGTLRIITNKPDLSGFSGALDVTGTSVAKGDAGDSIEGYVNVPLSEKAAIRLVGFYEHDGGFVDNVRGPDDQVYPTSGIPRDNSALVKKDINSVESYGGRAALAVNLDESWTATASIMAQHEKSDGIFAYKPSLGDLRIDRYFPDTQKDRWYQAALVIEGKIGRFDLTYAGAYFERTAEYTADYADYAYFYDLYYASTPEYFGNNFVDNDGNLISPGQYLTQHEDFTKQSHEIRISSPSDDQLRFVGGLFYQRQTNDWINDYIVPGLGIAQSVTGLPGVNYANRQMRTDRDYAAFAEAAFDILPYLTLTAGLRAYKYDNDVIGFFGYNATRSEVGEALCIPSTIGQYGNKRPCDNIDANAEGSGIRHKLNLSWKAMDGKLIYATWSTGFRPGGINRRPSADAYAAEKLANFEIGWKTSWADGALRYNGAVFLEKLTDAQFAVTSDQNGITDIVNAGRAKSTGVEADLTWIPLPGLSLQGSTTYVKARITTDLCAYPNADFDCSQPSAGGSKNSVRAPAGRRFANSPRFKLAATARYDFTLDTVDAFIQGSAFHQTSVLPSLDAAEGRMIGRQPGYTTFDFSVGIVRNDWSVTFAVENAFDKRAEQTRYASCEISVCGPESIIVYPLRPRLISLQLGKTF